MRFMEGRFLIGYARVSTEDQDLRLQIDAIRRYGGPDMPIIREKKSGKSLKNRKLYRALDLLRPGDRIVVWKLDRLGRSVKDLITVVETLEAVGADLVSLTEGIDTSTAMGRFFFHIMAAIAELERGMISERTKAGMLAKKLADPNFTAGAPPKIEGVPARLAQIQVLYDAGEIELAPKYRQRGPNKGQRAGYTLKGRGKLEPLREALNACAPGAPEIKSSLTISRWLEDGCPGLKLREDDK